jgi:hypothetical protein
MQGLINTPIDQKNIGLAKLLYELRQNLDIYCLLSVNAGKIDIGKAFFGHLQQLVIKYISMDICKIFEDENNYELNSIPGIIRHLSKSPTVFEDSKIRNFVQKYGGPSDAENLISALKVTVNNYKKRHRRELNRFKTFRDKKIAHSEHGFSIENLPSYDSMERLFSFGKDFYNLIASTIIGVGPADIRNDIKFSLKTIFEKLGIKYLSTEML